MDVDIKRFWKKRYVSLKYAPHTPYKLPLVFVFSLLLWQDGTQAAGALIQGAEAGRQGAGTVTGTPALGRPDLSMTAELERNIFYQDNWGSYMSDLTYRFYETSLL